MPRSARLTLAVLLLVLGSLAWGCPTVPDPVAGVSEGCLLGGCHGPIEKIHHGGPALACVDCHLGDPKAATKEAAHVTVDFSFNPSTPGANPLGRPSMKELDELPLDVVRFLNPADYRVAAAACGSSALGGAQCHPSIVDTSLLMNRYTLAGQFSGGGFIAGVQDKDVQWGVTGVQDPYTPATLPEGAVSGIDRLPASPPASITDPIARAFFPVMEQLCTECHVGQDGRHQPGSYYSSGCNACHMITADDARAQTADPTQDIDELGHVQSHRFTNLIPDSQCARCHVSHLGRALLIRGVRERSEPEGDAAIGGPNRGVEDPEEAVFWGEQNYVRHQGEYQIYGKPYPFYIEDEDGTNAIDETPPDVHAAAGMGCIDCHNIREAHGDNTMSARMDGEIDVRCETCHGRPGAVATLRSDAGLAFNRAETTAGGTGINRPVFSEDADGQVQQYVRFTKANHAVTQITERTDPAQARFNANTQMGCKLHAGDAATRAALKLEVNALAAADPDAVSEGFPGLIDGFTFAVAEQETDGRLECFTCHNAWTLNCYGCHMVRDDRDSYVSALDGETKQGAVASYGMSVVADSLAMGFGTRGRITPLVGTSIFFSHIDATGDAVIDAQALTDGDGVKGEGNVHNPVHHHTVRQIPRDCDGCHPSATGSHDEPALLTALGLGSGRYTFLDGDGRTHLLDRLVQVDVDGDGGADDVHLTGLPAAVMAVAPAVSTTHDLLPTDLSAQPPPGPLDLDTINRTLGAVVLPQRE